MKLNRWTILAAILLVSTVVGLAFRPWGSGEGEFRTIMGPGLTLTCPESYTVASQSGGSFDLKCEILLTSELQTGYNVFGSSSGYAQTGNGWETKIAPDRYTYTTHYIPRTSEKVRVSAYVAKGRFPFPESQRRAIAEVQILVPRLLPFNVAHGLSFLQIVVLVAGPLLGLVLGAKGLVAHKGGPIARLRFSIRTAVYAAFLIVPWLQFVRRGENARLAQNRPTSSGCFLIRSGIPICSRRL